MLRSARRAPLLSCSKDEGSESLEERFHHEFAKVVKANRKQKKVMTEGFAPLLPKRVDVSVRSGQLSLAERSGKQSKRLNRVSLSGDPSCHITRVVRQF